MNAAAQVQDQMMDTTGRKLTVPPSIALWAKRLQSGLEWANQKYATQRSSKRLKVAETVSLGEKRFVSILQVDGTQFLIGGTASSVTLLATMEVSPDFAEILKSQATLAAEQR